MLVRKRHVFVPRDEEAFEELFFKTFSWERKLESVFNHLYDWFDWLVIVTAG